jgi:hypothetical protein
MKHMTRILALIVTLCAASCASAQVLYNNYVDGIPYLSEQSGVWTAGDVLTARTAPAS